MNLEKLKEFRKKHGLTQTQLAKEVGVSLMTIRLWEDGISYPNQDNLGKLKKVLERQEARGE